MCMKNTVLIVSNYILRYAKEKGKGLSVLQLMDYLYFVQAQVLVVKNRPAFPETLIAKDWGIFVQDVWSTSIAGTEMPLSRYRISLKIAYRTQTL